MSATPVTTPRASRTARVPSRCRICASVTPWFLAISPEKIANASDVGYAPVVLRAMRGDQRLGLLDPERLGFDGRHFSALSKL